MTYSTTDLALCLDGPLNGTYKNYLTPPEGYIPAVWPSGEVVLLHESNETHDLDGFGNVRS